MILYREREEEASLNDIIVITHRELYIVPLHNNYYQLVYVYIYTPYTLSTSVSVCVCLVKLIVTPDYDM